MFSWMGIYSITSLKSHTRIAGSNVVMLNDFVTKSRF